MGLLRWVSNRLGFVGSWSWFALVVFGFQIGSGDDFFFIGVGLCLFVYVVVFVVCGLCKRLREPEKKKNGWKAQENEIRPRQFWIERNNKER